MDSNTQQRTGLRYVLVVAFACGCAILGAGCAKHTTAPRVSPQISGSVTLVVAVTDVNGHGTDSLTEASDSGVMVRVLTRAGLRDSAASVHGSFTVRVGSDSTWLVVGPSVATSDTIGPWLAGEAGVGGVALRLHGKGNLGILNSVASSGMLAAYFSAARAERIVIRILGLDGRDVRTLADQTFAAGAHIVAWDTHDASDVPVPAGTYWVTCEAGSSTGGAPLHALGIPSAEPPPDSAGSRALVRIVRS